MNEQIDEASGTKRKRNPGVSIYDYGTLCICCNPKCDTSMAGLKLHNPERCGYIEIPKEPKPESELKRKPEPANIKNRAMKSQCQRRILKALPRAATARVADDRYSSEKSLE